MPSSNSPRRSGSTRKSSPPLLQSLLRTAVSALAESSSSKSHSSRDRSHRSTDPKPGHLPRSHTQPEPRRPTDYSSSTGIPSHTSPSTSKDHTFDLLRTAAYELGKLVHDIEGKVKPSYRPEHLENDDERFEVLSDSETTLDERRRARKNRDRRDRDDESRSGRRRHRAGSEERADHRDHRYRDGEEQHRDGHAQDYYGYSSPAPVQPQQGQYGYGDYTGQFDPAAQTHSYPYPPPAPQQNNPNTYHPNLNNGNAYTHPLPSPQPLYEEEHSTSRPKLKRANTTASKMAGQMGGELMRNLPALLDKAGWLLGLLEAKNKASGGRSAGGHSALLMALGLVMELYRQFGGKEALKGWQEKRERKAARADY